MGSRPELPCPRCADLVDDRLDLCPGCGARIRVTPLPIPEPHYVPLPARVGPFRCIYCGLDGWGLACAKHADLLPLDPSMVAR